MPTTSRDGTTGARRNDRGTHSRRRLTPGLAMYHWTCVGTTTTVELNPVEAVWSHLKRSLADLAGYFGS